MNVIYSNYSYISGFDSEAKSLEKPYLTIGLFKNNSTLSFSSESNPVL